MAVEREDDDKEGHQYLNLLCEGDDASVREEPLYKILRKPEKTVPETVLWVA